jgi:flagellar basal-body rod protein FlgB
MDNVVNPITTALVQQALDQAVARHAVHAHNIANAHTPGYRARAVSFQSALALEAGRTTQAGAMPAGTAAAVLRDTGAAVNVASEAAALAENTLNYQALVRMLNRQISIAAIALNDGKR